MSVAWGAWLGQPANPTIIEGPDGDVDVLELVVRGLLDGTDPSGRWWWRQIHDRDQRIVEAAEIATGLWLGRDRIVPALGPENLERVLDWLAQVHGRDLYRDNWVLFPALVGAVERAFDRDVPDSAIDTGVDEMVAWYAADGWYRDGDGEAFDQYTGWAIHWHLLLWARIEGDRRPRLRSLVERRARTYLRSIVPLYTPDGLRPLQGRSLGYRFAAAAPFALDALLGLGAVNPALARRIANDMIGRHLRDGALDPDSGWFRRGVGGERPDVCERYMSAGASAWAAHALVALGLPPEAPFWSEPDPPLPVEEDDGFETMRGPGFLAGRRRPTGETWLLSALPGHPDDIPGHDYTPFYGKFAYRSHFPITVRTADGRPGPDDAVVFEAGGDRRHRAVTDAGGAGTAWVWARYRVSVGGAEHGATTVILPWRDVEVRITGVRPGGPVRLVEGPAALGADAPDDVARESSAAEGWATASAGGRSVAIRALLGYAEVRPSAPFGRGPDRNLVADHAEQPVAAEATETARRRILATVTAAVAAPVPPIDELRAVEARVAGPRQVELTLGDEEHALAVVSSRAVAHAELAGFRFEGPGLRVARVRRDGSRLAGEAIGSIDGVVRLDRPGVIDVWRHEPGLVEVLTATGFTLDAEWAGFIPRLLEAREHDGWHEVATLDDGRVPAAVIRRLRRESGRSLVTVRARP